jgi:hypothetical protein
MSKEMLGLPTVRELFVERIACRENRPSASMPESSGRAAGPTSTDAHVKIDRRLAISLLFIGMPFFFSGGSALAQAAAPAISSVWPRTISRNGASVTIYQPQAVQWPERRTLIARAAVAITPAHQRETQLGTVEISLQTSVDEANGIVQLSNPELLTTHFPSLDTEHATALEAKIRAALPEMQIHSVPLAAVLLSLNQTSVKSVELNNDPPRMFYADRPASLVVFGGDPVMVPAGKSGLSYAVNTNWEVFAIGGEWYLLNNGTWLKAPAATGPYAVTTELPPAFNALPADATFADARKAIPARKPTVPPPAIFVSTVPAEIIVTDGAPRFSPVAGTSLKRVTNTPNTLFFDDADSHFYVLLAGRWFSASSLDGTAWTFATDKLPADFALIPADSPEGAVLPSVPGTVQAQEAVLKAQIPTTATLNRSATRITVHYVGPPRFELIPGTAILHAMNTQSVVLKIGDRYYACEAGAWFVAALPTGPWALADAIPAAIRTISPSSPYYPVTYVEVYDATPTAVTYGYTAGYTMGFVTAGVLVYGTGYYYPPVVVAGPVPVYFPYSYTYAGPVCYSATGGAWVSGGSVWGSYYGASGAAAYNPATGAWAQGGAIWGPNGGAGAWSYYNPSNGSYARGSAYSSYGSGVANGSYYNAQTGVSGSTNQNWNAYSRWGSSTVAGPNQTVNTQSGSNAYGSAGSFQSTTGAEGAGYHNSVTGSSGGAVKTANGDVYAGRDGNVYQHTDSGWSKWNNGSWQPVNQPKSSGNTPQSGAAGSSNRSASGSPASAGRSSNVDSSSWNQLQQDHMGRQFGRGQMGRQFGQGQTGQGQFGQRQFQGRFGGRGGRFWR